MQNLISESNQNQILPQLSLLSQGKNNYLETIFDNMIEGCQVIGFDFRYLYANKSVAKQGQSTKEKLLGHTMMEMYPGIEKTELFKNLQRCMSERIFISIENEFKFPDGSKGWFELRMEPVPVGVLIFSIDITEHKAIDQAKSEFISVASHALRTPLGISKWYLEVMREKKYVKISPETADRYINEVYDNNERILSLVRNLLSVSRIDQGHIKNDPQLVDILSIIKKAIKNMHALAEKNEVSLSLKLKIEEVPHLFIDPTHLEVVIENLVSNAIYYNVPSGKVEIIIDKEKENLLLDIKDTGIGIPDNEKKKIFTRFFRGQKALTKNTEGSGLGLSVTKSYVESWGGTITVRSGKEKGCTFSIKIPLQKKGKGEI